MILERLAKTPKEFQWGGTLERVCSMWHKPSTINRVLRMLAEDGIIDVTYEHVLGVRRPVVKYKFKNIIKKKCTH